MPRAAGLLVALVVTTMTSQASAGGGRPMPRRLGSGLMSTAFLAPDGRHVIKKVRARLGGVKRLRGADRARLAARSVALMDVLRRGGIPVPPAVVPDGHPGLIVQELAPAGASFGALPWRARPRALASAARLYARAVVLAARAGHRPTLIDPKISNFRFDARGRVVSWFDPVGAVGPLQWLKLRAQAL